MHNCIAPMDDLKPHDWETPRAKGGGGGEVGRPQNLPAAKKVMI